ncbi:MAG: replication-associated recombination protein A [Clostridiales bacterium]|jgi:putative ATPase|nr:replication-associated recombination protein A [Clostridiales bacterium]
MDLFSEGLAKLAPLADRMRPESMNDFYGQAHIVGAGSLLRRAIVADKLGSCIFYGPPGVGKTSLANVIANNTKGAFTKLNAVSSGVADAKKVIEEARNLLAMYGKRTYLLLDECHRWNKAQSDCVLSAIEEGAIVFIGSTTENPYVAMTRAIVSRCRIFEFKQLSAADIERALLDALDSPKGLKDLRVKIDGSALKFFAWAAAGDLRTAYNALELAATTTPVQADGYITINGEIAEQSIQKKALSIDETMYYDMLSAFCKSLRGSDADAALYWAMRLIESGCDPMLVIRRLTVHSAEDVGLANPNALTVAVAALTAFEKIGLPEGLIPLTEAIIYVASSPKSNSVVTAYNEAKSAAAGSGDALVPLHLRDTSYPLMEKPKIPYKYPHDYGGYTEQQYLPDGLKDSKFYRPGDNGNEVRLKEFLRLINPKKYL